MDPIVVGLAVVGLLLFFYVVGRLTERRGRRRPRRRGDGQHGWDLDGGSGSDDSGGGGSD